jgi:RNA polymerase subunit RPABC4/transcription elongation factor Spt4
VVVARWSHRTATEATRCDECGEHLDVGTTQCPQCRQAAAATATGMLAVVVETTAGDRRLVVAERTPTGGWAPTRHVPATNQAVRALARQDLTRDGAA